MSGALMLNDCTDGDIIGGDAVYSKGILVDGGSRSGADGSCQSCRL